MTIDATGYRDRILNAKANKAAAATVEAREYKAAKKAGLNIEALKAVMPLFIAWRKRPEAVDLLLDEMDALFLAFGMRRQSSSLLDEDRAVRARATALAAATKAANGAGNGQRQETKTRAPSPSGVRPARGRKTAELEV